MNIFAKWEKIAEAVEQKKPESEKLKYIYFFKKRTIIMIITSHIF